MIKLTTTPMKRYYFTKSGIIFNIKSVYNGTDECAVLFGPDNYKGNIPSLTVTENKNNEEIQTTYYLDAFIKDGDGLSSLTFSKTVHKSEGNEETITFANYYKSLCEDRIEEIILSYYNKDYEWFKNNINKFDIPSYMLANENITVTSNEGEFAPIDFSEEYFNSKKEEAVREASLNAANNVANKYGYSVDEDNFNIIPFDNHEYVEIGGLKWATMNVGATKVTDTGFLFQWGDSKGYTASQVGEGKGQKYFGSDDYKYGDGENFTKYSDCDGRTELDELDDGARANWGKNWRMPTKAEFQHFCNSVDYRFVGNYQDSGISGYLCTDKTDSSKVLFFPLCGSANYGQIDLKNVEGHYWTSSLNSDQIQKAYELFTDDEDNFGLVGNSRTYGYPIRAIHI